MIDLYVFSSATLTNIWAGIGSRNWAVSLEQGRNASIQGKAKNLPIGGLGIFYCVQEKALTTPFLIRSKPEPNRVIEHIWPEKWSLPFRIVPLGSPDSLITTIDLKKLLPSLSTGAKRWNELFHVSPLTVFAASKISETDWEILVSRLADE
jgi:hypothetical protein